MNEAVNNNGKKIFVTGASGLVGSHLISALLSKGYEITALYRKQVPKIVGADKVQWVQGDILDVICLQEAMDSIDEVYHCAAMVSFHPKDKKELMQVNVAGTANLVNAALAANVTKFCFVSSVAAFGKIKSAGLIAEDVEFTKDYESAYGLSKYLAETEVWRAIGEGLPCAIVNPTIILGASDWSSGSSQIFKSAYESFPWYAEGINGFVDVVDVVNAMIMLMESNVSGERFIVSAENKTYKEIFTTIANTFSKQPPHKKVTRILAAFVWRLEAIKAMVTGKAPLVTKETARSALEKISYDNTKLKRFLPSFAYTPISETIRRVCSEFGG